MIFFLHFTESILDGGSPTHSRHNYSTEGLRTAWSTVKQEVTGPSVSLEKNGLSRKTILETNKITLNCDT